MLTKSRRITRQDFPTQQAGGFTLHEKHLSLRVTPKKANNKAVFAAVVSKKVAKSSPRRHVWKRRIYESITRYEKKHAAKEGSYVFFAKKGSPELAFRDLVKEVEHLMKEAQAIM